MREMTAYLLTLRIYGTRLHGDERGSVDKENNRYIMRGLQGCLFRLHVRCTSWLALDSIEGSCHEHEFVLKIFETLFMALYPLSCASIFGTGAEVVAALSWGL
jgi:hypothetical protein